MELIINHSSFGFSEELRIFLIEDRDEFLKTKRNMNSYIEELTLLGNSINMKRVAQREGFLYLREAFRGFQAVLWTKLFSGARSGSP